MRLVTCEILGRGIPPTIVGGIQENFTWASSLKGIPYCLEGGGENMTVKELLRGLEKADPNSEVIIDIDLGMLAKEDELCHDEVSYVLIHKGQVVLMPGERIFTKRR